MSYRADANDPVATVVRIILVGLAKEIAEKKELSLTEDPERHLLVIEQHEKGYLTVTRPLWTVITRLWNSASRQFVRDQ